MIITFSITIIVFLSDLTSNTLGHTKVSERWPNGPTDRKPKDAYRIFETVILFQRVCRKTERDPIT